MKKILIQLIGEQTLPNIFPILAVCPDVVFNIYTKGTVTMNEAIIAWCHKFRRHFNLNTLFQPLEPVSEEFDNLRKELACIVNEKVGCVTKEEPSMIILNMTGGTKPMAIFSMEICKKYEKDKGVNIPIFYVDTRNKEFHFLAHEEMREQVLVYGAFTRTLSLSQLVESGGKTRIIDYRDEWPKVLKAACLMRRMCANLRKVDISLKNVRDMIGVPMQLLMVGENSRKRVEDFIREALQDHEVIEGLELCGFEQRDGSFYFNKKLFENAKQIAEMQFSHVQIHDKETYGKMMDKLFAIQSAHNFLFGGWWEVLVAHAYSCLNPYSEILWSVRTSVGGGMPLETDIVASDGLSLTCISCKRCPHKKVNQDVEQHSTRTEILGGAISKRIIAVYRDAMKMAPMAKALRMELWGWNGESVGKLEIEDKSTTN